MREFLYFFWFLLPLAFLLMAIWAVIKRFAKVPGREYAKEYLNQAMFCGIALGISIWIDQTVFESVVESTNGEWLDIGVARWLLYPGVLLLMGYLQQLYQAKFGKKSTHKRMGSRL